MLESRFGGGFLVDGSLAAFGDFESLTWDDRRALWWIGILFPPTSLPSPSRPLRLCSIR